MTKKAILLFSGGQDSTTLLGWCLKKFDAIELLSFDYGQKHIIELQSNGFAPPPPPLQHSSSFFTK